MSGKKAALIVKEFLSPKWQKFIFPVLLIILFSFYVWQSYDNASTLNNYYCDFQEGTDVLFDWMEGGATFGEEYVILNKTNMTYTDEDFERFQIAYLKLYEISFSDSFGSYIILQGQLLKSLNPLVPLPCELMWKNESFSCEFFINENTYSCFADGLHLLGEEYIEYRPVSEVSLLLSVIIFFTEGYLVSCLVFLVFDKLKLF